MTAPSASSDGRAIVTASDAKAVAEIVRRADALRVELARTRSDYESILIHLSELSGTVNDSARRNEMEVVATVVATDYELKVLLLKVLTESEDREVWLKYLALVSWTAIEELPRRLGANLAGAGRSFKQALKPIRDDADFMRSLEEIRNKVAAHRDLTDGDHWLAQWHLSEIANKHNATTVLRSKVVLHAGTVLKALRELGEVLLSQHQDLCPPRG